MRIKSYLKLPSSVLLLVLFLASRNDKVVHNLLTACHGQVESSRAIRIFLASGFMDHGRCSTVCLHLTRPQRFLLLQSALAPEIRNAVVRPAQWLLTCQPMLI